MLNWIEKKIAYIKYAMILMKHDVKVDKEIFERYYTK